MRSLLLLALLAALVAAGEAAAAGSRRVTHRAAEWPEGTLEGLAVDALGELRPAARVATRLPVEADAFYVWALLADRSGRVVAGSGDGGWILREEDGALAPWAATLALEILCLFQTDRGLLAGSSPDGVVYRVDGEGAVQVALDLPQQSVWALAAGEKAGAWIAAAGPPARLVQVDAGHPAGRVLAELPATNATVLLRDGDGLWIGTQGPGLVYRLASGAESPELLFEAPEDEIRGIVSDGTGGVYVLSTGPARPAGNGKGGGDGALPPPVSRVSWLHPDGARETVLEAGERLLSLAARPGGGLWLGEAETGRIHHVDAGGGRSLWIELGEGDVLALAAQSDGALLAATGNPATVARLKAGPAKGGRFISPVVPTPNALRWGRLWAEGESGALRYSTRTGVRSLPDESWSDWSEAQPLGETIQSPVRPYLQYRLELEEAGPTVSVAAVHVAYAERNLAPQIVELRVEPAGGALGAGGANPPPAPLSQRFADGLTVEYNVYRAREAAADEGAAWARGLRTVRWQASDPNGDPLRYRLELRREPDGPWYALAEDLEGEVYAWDTRAFEDGLYRLRVVASDRLANAPGREREGVRVGAPVTVDNRPPQLVDPSWKAGEGIRFALHDPGARIASVALREDEGPWRPLEPVDGVLDGPRERFELAEDAVPAAARLWLRVVDAAGNVTLAELRREGR